MSLELLIGCRAGAAAASTSATAAANTFLPARLYWGCYCHCCPPLPAPLPDMLQLPLLLPPATALLLPKGQLAPLPTILLLPLLLPWPRQPLPATATDTALAPASHCTATALGPACLPRAGRAEVARPPARLCQLSVRPHAPGPCRYLDFLWPSPSPSSSPDVQPPP